MNEKKNVLLWKFGKECTRNVYKHLSEHINIEVIIDREKDWPDKKECPAAMYDMNDFYRNLSLSKDYHLKTDYQHRKEYLDIYKKLKQDANTFLYVYSRRPTINGENNFQDMMDAFHIYIHLYIDILETHNIDHVIFLLTPHHSDFILYRIAEELGIKTLMFHPSLLIGKTFMFTGLNQIGVFDNDDQEIKPVKIERRQRQSYLDNPVRKKAIKQLRKQPNPYIKALSALLLRRDIDLFFQRLLNIRKTRQFKKNYRLTATDAFPQGKFVYFPLHLQPELTTAPLGGDYADQVLAIESLRVLLPDDWAIAVKENPAQTFHSRGPLFFERLRHIPNTLYLDKQMNTFDLIEKCEFVATITGTAGTEALSFGKRVLFFGNAIYRDFPGIIRYTDDIRLEDIMAVEFTHEELEMAHGRMQKNMDDVILEVGALELPHRLDNDANARKLAEAINEFVSRTC